MNICKIIYSYSIGVILLSSCSPSLNQIKDKSENEIRSTYTLYSDIAYGTDSLQTMDVHKSGSANTLKGKTALGRSLPVTYHLILLCHLKMTQQY